MVRFADDQGCCCISKLNGTGSASCDSLVCAVQADVIVQQ